MNKVKLFALSAMSLAVAGCNSIPSVDDYNQMTERDAIQKAMERDSWVQGASITRLYSSVGEMITRPKAIPSDISNRKVKLELESGATLKDLVAILSRVEKISVISENDGILDRRISLPHFDGELGSLLNTISRSQDISFNWDGNAISISERSSYMVTLPQDDDLMDKIQDEVVGLGAEDVRVSVSSGIMFYKASPKTQDDIEKYINRLVRNSALITLQVMVINVNLERDRREGFDWGNIQASLGDLNIQQATIGEDGIISSAASSTSGQSGRRADISGAAAVLGLTNNSVNITALFNLLSTYGRVQTTQDVSLKTLSGKEVSLESAQHIPFVSDINLSTTDTGLSNSGITTDTAKNGLTIGFKPYYEADSELVSLDIEIDLDTLLGFVDLSAGNQIGSITQPRTQKQSFNNTVRIPAGDTVILGGVTYESLSDNRQTLSVIEQSDLANLNEKITSNSLFVVIRPTITVYEPRGVSR